MNDFFGIVGKFLPVGVIASLVMIFYLLDVFSLGREANSVVVKSSDATASSATQSAKGSPQVGKPPAIVRSSAARQTGDSSISPSQAASEHNENPAANNVNVQSEQDAPPRYVPPPNGARQPLAGGTNTVPADGQMPSNEIADDNNGEESQAPQIIPTPEGAVGPRGPTPSELPGDNGRGG